MRPSRRLIFVLVAAGTVAGCGVAAQAGTAQQTGQSTAKTQAHSLAVSHTSSKAKYRLGLDMDFYTYPGQDITKYAEPDIQYVKSVHANALSVAFPFFVTGPKASYIFKTPETPSPAELAILAQDAKKAGLYFSLRPLLDEYNLRKVHSSRIGYKPPNLAKWFASYEKFLKPYAQMAQKYGIPQFVTGVEFDAFNSSPYWAKLDTYLRRYYHGTLAYSNNWSVPIPKRVNSAGVVQMDDAYPIIRDPDSASVAKLTAAWDKYLGTKPSGTLLSEVGIAAQSNAYHVPYNVVWNGKPLKPTIQVHWFDAVCNAMVNEHDAGVYFWAFNFGQDLTIPPNTSSPASYVAGPGQKAISACFKRLG